MPFQRQRKGVQDRHHEQVGAVRVRVEAKLCQRGVDGDFDALREMVVETGKEDDEGGRGGDIMLA